MDRVTLIYPLVPISAPFLWVYSGLYGFILVSVRSGASVGLLALSARPLPLCVGLLLADHLGLWVVIWGKTSSNISLAKSWRGFGAVFGSPSGRVPTRCAESWVWCGLWVASGGYQGSSGGRGKSPQFPQKQKRGYPHGLQFYRFPYQRRSRRINFAF